MAPGIALGSLAHYSAGATRCALALPRGSDLQAARHHGTGIWVVQGPTVSFGLAVLSDPSRIGCRMRAHDASGQAGCRRKDRNEPTDACCLSSGPTARICAPRRPDRSGPARTVHPSQSPASAQANPEANRAKADRYSAIDYWHLGAENQSLMHSNPLNSIVIVSPRVALRPIIAPQTPDTVFFASAMPAQHISAASISSRTGRKAMTLFLSSNRRLREGATFHLCGASRSAGWQRSCTASKAKCECWPC